MLAPPQQAMDKEHGGVSSTRSKTQSDSLPDSSNPFVEGLISITSTSSSSSSSSSSRGSFDLLLELSKAKDDDHVVPISKLDQESASSPKPGPVEDSNQANDWNPYGSSVKQSPPVQTMGRADNPPGYDPNRIPLSVFTSKSTSPADWSVASNESLFSIHMGNNSFSRDHAILLGKSGELYKFDDLISSAPSQQPNLPTVMETTSDVDNYRQSVSIEEDSGAQKQVDISPKTLFLNNSSNISDGRDTPTHDGTRTSASTQRLSDGSGTNSSSSFAFPLLVSETGNNAPVKTARENVQHRHIEKPTIESPPQPQPQPQRQPQSHKPTPRAAGWRWFSWFPTLSFRMPRCSFCC